MFVFEIPKQCKKQALEYKKQFGITQKDYVKYACIYFAHIKTTKQLEHIQKMQLKELEKQFQK